MFGHKSLPSRIFSYGAKPPVENLENVVEQMRLAHRYKNALVNLELKRRGKVAKVLARLCPELAQLEEKIAPLEEERELLREQIRGASALARKKVRPPELVARTNAVSKALKPLWDRRKELKTPLYASKEWELEQTAMNAWESDKNAKLRAASGLYWGTYLHCSQSMAGIRSGKPPHFRRWDGDGHLAIQIQNKGEMIGLSMNEAFRGNDQRLKVDPVPEEAYATGGRRLRKTKVYFRIGSNDDRTPIMAVIPIVLHRPIPEDANIKWVHLLRRRIGTHYKWQVQFVVSRASGWDKPDRATSGMVAIDVGWRIKEDRSLRVAYYVGSDGVESELNIPADWLSEMRKTEDIRSIRDRLFDEVRSKFLSMKKLVALPEWLVKETEFLHLWKAQGKLAMVAIKWREQRFTGDEALFELVESWRKRDKHLYEYEANLRDQLQARRMDLYRCFAAKLRRIYKDAIVEDLDLRDFHILPNDEEEPENKAMRVYTRDACLSVLLRCIKESMAGFHEAPAKDTTKTCCYCGSVEEWDHKILIHTCSKCAATYDQDLCAARNLLQWGKENVQALASVTLS